jgi:phosphopantothenoylcysteine decarboxylase / phosphopantothenate---cysteine ligase
MASLTIRKLDETVKAYLRLRSAGNGRSVEEEVRVILGDLIRGRPEPSIPRPQAVAPPETPSRASRHAPDTADQLRVTLIIGGGIAAYKALDLIRRLKERRIQVRCVLTRAAQQFVTPLSASALSNERAYTDLFDAASEFDAGHIRLGRDCDLIVVAPATADLMAKMAQGHADDLASAILLAANRPILLAPAMNPQMWNNAATRRNVAQLERDGVAMVGPNAGEMAEANEAGVGRMAEPTEIAAAAEKFLRPPQVRPLAGKRVLITAGPTHEPIDPVRFLGNRSSGRMGVAIAEEALARGASVTLVFGPGSVVLPAGADIVAVQTAEEMRDAVLEWFDRSDAVVMAAAVADFRPKVAPRSKLKKEAGVPELILEPTPDILAELGERRSGQVLVGFAAETDDLEAAGRTKLAAKHLDLIVVNLVGREGTGFGSDTNEAMLLAADGDDVPVARWTKAELARLVADRLAPLLREHPSSVGPDG